jgi:hypothetical protein
MKSGVDVTASYDLRKSEESESLWMLAISPAIWTLHFLLSYIAAAIWCGMIAERGASLSGVHVAIVAYTVAALIAISVSGWYGFRRQRSKAREGPHDADNPEDRHEFLGFATLLLSGLSALATIYVATAALLIRSCH